MFSEIKIHQKHLAAFKVNRSNIKLKKIIITGIFYTLVFVLFGCSEKSKEDKMNKNEKPPVHIGYYLKTLDNMLTVEINKIQEASGLSRPEWQILNSIYQKPNIQKDTLVNVVKEFTDVTVAQKLINNLIERGLVTGSSALRLTKQGTNLHDKALNMQKAFRKKAAKNISQEEYDLVISVLDKMIENLKADE